MFCVKNIFLLFLVTTILEVSGSIRFSLKVNTKKSKKYQTNELCEKESSYLIRLMFFLDAVVFFS